VFNSNDVHRLTDRNVGRTVLEVASSSSTAPTNFSTSSSFSTAPT
jgi:hypothetical protein